MSRIASAVGIPLFADECATKQIRISYERMWIEVDVTKPMPNEITVMDAQGQAFQHIVSYDLTLEYCE